MTRLRALIGVEVKNHFSLTVLWRQIKHGVGRRRVLAITALLTVSLLPLLFVFVQGVQWLFVGLRAVGQESALIVLGVLVGQLLIFVLGLFYIISAFYFSRDLETLIPLPVRPHHVVLSKLTVVVINEYLMIAPIVLPILLGYGVLARAPLDYWVLLPPVYLLLPIIPLCLSALLAIGLMRVVNLSRRKDALIIVGTLLLICVQLFVNTRLGRIGGDPDSILRLFSEENGLIQIIGRSFPPSVWASRSLALGLSGGGWLQFLLLAGCSALVFLGVVILAEKLFYQGAIGLNEIAARRRRLTQVELERGVSAGHHPVRAILQREIRLMNRTPIFLLNGVLAVVIVPVVVLFGAGTSGSSESLLAMLRKLTEQHAASGILALAAFFLVCGCLNGTASSAISREGRFLWISKVIPVPWRQQLAAKFIHSYLVGLLGIAVATGVAAVALGMPAAVLAPAALLALAGAVLLTLLGLRIDLARPQLKWTNPQVAIKQNLNVVFAMLADLSYLAACGFLAHALLRVGVSGVVVLLTLLAITVAAAGFAWRELVTFAERKYPRIEI